MTSARSWLELLEQPERLRESLDQYELRPAQVEMARHLALVFQEGGITTVEAPTGTGKTLAYLLPALEMAQLHGWRVLISTHTIPLQKQILQKDLPLAAGLLGRSIGAMQLVGLNQYLCLRNFNQWAYQDLTHDPQSDLKQKLREDLKENPLALRSDWKDLPGDVWQHIGASEDCTRQHCSFYNECAYFKDRRRASQAQVLVINHHLLGAELKRRVYEGPAVLGAWDLLIIDEAHHLMDALTKQLSFSLSEGQLSPWLARFWVHHPGSLPRGWLALVKQALARQFTQNSSYSDVEALLLQSSSGIDRLWVLARAFQVAASKTLSQTSKEAAHVLLPPDWCDIESYEPLKRALLALYEELDQVLLSIEDILSNIKEMSSYMAVAQLIPLHQEGSVLVRVMRKLHMGLQKLTKPYEASQEVVWLQQTNNLCSMQHARFDLSDLIHKHLLEPSRAAVFCSATLGASQNFEPLRSDLALGRLESRLKPLRVDSTFDWKEQSHLILCNNMPFPVDPNYEPALLKVLEEMGKKVQGRILILETSIQRVERLSRFLQDKLERPVLYQKQGMSREILLNKFRELPDSILLGADSFWEGIDLAGEPIACVIMTKLPFDVPSEPLLEAKAKALHGKDSFWNYLLPRAVLRFQQGVGRLLRHRRDRGCIVCLDSRLVKARYSSRFLNAHASIQGKSLWEKISKENICSQIADYQKQWQNFLSEL
jgi:ATP-dependent DNA helicase DinG